MTDKTKNADPPVGLSDSNLDEVTGGVHGSAQPNSGFEKPSKGDLSGKPGETKVTTGSSPNGI